MILKFHLNVNKILIILAHTKMEIENIRGKEDNALPDKKVLNNDIIELGRNIKFCRKKQHMTQYELGHKSYMSDKALSRIENGNIVPGVDKVFHIADALNVTPLELAPKRFRDRLLSDRMYDDLLRDFLWKQMDEQKRYIALHLMSVIVGKEYTNLNRQI